MGLNEKFFKSAAPAAGSDYFNTVLYTGNGYPNSGTQPITGVGFKPDLVFIKARNTTAYPAMVDVIRGNLKYLYPNVTLAQATQNGTGFLTFDIDGFSLGADTAGDGVNRTQDGAYVSFNFKAGGDAVAGTGTNAQNVSYSANPDSGFSIVKFTANGSSTYTASHGLNQAPELVITKALTASANWISYASSLGISKYLFFDTNAAQGSFSNIWAGMSSTHIGGSSAAYGGSHTVINYVFHSVTDVQKIGSYTGNGNNTGTVVDTGFTPSFVMIKSTSTNDSGDGNWIIYDNKRSTSNPRNIRLYANDRVAEDTKAAYNLDFLTGSTKGFQPLNGTSGGRGFNTLNVSYIYLAIA